MLSLLLASVLLGCTGDDSTEGRSPVTTSSTVLEGSSPDGAKAVVPDAVARPLVDALGCTITVLAKGGGIGGPWIDQSLDCYRSNRFVARIHIYRSGLDADVVEKVRGAFTIRSPITSSANPAWCGPPSPGVVAGDRWILVVPDEGDAARTAALTGGSVLPPSSNSGPIPSYILPLACDGQP